MLEGSGTHLGEEVSGGASDGRREEEVVVQNAFVHHVHVAVVERGLRVALPTPMGSVCAEGMQGRLGGYQSRQHLIEESAQAPPVHRTPVALPAKNLGS